MTDQQTQHAHAVTVDTARAREAARQFVAAHGKPVSVVVQNLGRTGSRMVLIAPNGRIGDVIVADVATGNAVIEAEEDLQAAEWDSETVGRTTIGPARRRNMGHSVTRG